MVRKLAVVVLAVAMVMSCMGLASAAKFPDTAGHKQEAAIDRLTSLGLLKGYPDGTFKPDAAITRAEFAKVMVCALGLETAAEMMATTPTVFSDVPAGYWATGYINVAASQGIVNGYPDGTFKPDAQVTYAEALKMILCALGYKPEVFRTIVWPVTWVAKAMDLKITDGVALASGAASLPATRADVARLVDNALDEPMLVQVGYGDEIKYVRSGEEGTKEKTLLSCLDYKKVSGRVVDIALTNDDLDEDEVMLEDGEVYTLPEGASALALLGLEVDMWHKDGDVAFYEVTTDASDVIYDTVDEVTADDVTLLVKDDTFDWATEEGKVVAKVFENFKSVDRDEIAGTWGRFVLDDDGDVIFACVFAFDTPNAGLVKEVADDEITYLREASEKELDLGDYDSVSVYDTKLGALKVEDIKADSLIYGFVDGDNLYLVVAGEKKEGELEAARDTKLTLDGKSYNYGGVKTYSLNDDEDVAAITGAEDLEDLLGESVAVILDINGQVRHVRGSVTTTTALQFGVALKGSPAGLDTPAKIKILGKDGVAKTYELEDEDDYPPEADWDGNENTLVAFKLNAKGQIAKGELYFGLEAIDGLEGYDVFMDADVPDDVDDTDDYIEFGGDLVYVTDDTVIFNELGFDDEDVDVVAWASIEDMKPELVELTVVKEAKGKDAAAIYFVDGYDEAVAEEALYGVVVDAPWLTSDGWKVKIDVYGEGEKEYLLAESDLRNSLPEGAVVEFYLDAEDKIAELGTTADDEVIAEVSGSYVKIGSEWYKVATDAVLYQLDEDGIDVAIDVGDLEGDLTVDYVLDAGKIVALAVQYVEEEAPPAPPEVVTGWQNVAGGTEKITFQLKVKQGDTAEVRVYDGAKILAFAEYAGPVTEWTTKELAVPVDTSLIAEARLYVNGVLTSTKLVNVAAEVAPPPALVRMEFRTFYPSAAPESVVVREWYDDGTAVDVRYELFDYATLEVTGLRVDKEDLEAGDVVELTLEGGLVTRIEVTELANVDHLAINIDSIGAQTQPAADGKYYVNTTSVSVVFNAADTDDDTYLTKVVFVVTGDVEYTQEFTGTEAAPADGARTVTLTAQDGDEFTVTITVVNNAGATNSVSEQVVVDTQAPAAPVVVSPPPAGLVTNDTTPDIVVRAEAGATIEVLEGAATVGQGTGAGEADVTITLTLTAGVHNLTVKATDAAGNSSSASVPTITVDTQAPQLAGLTAAAGGSTVTVEITENETALKNQVDPAAFTASVNGLQVRVESVVIDTTTNTVTLTLNVTLAVGDKVSVAYQPTGTNDIEDAAGNKAPAKVLSGTV